MAKKKGTPPKKRGAKAKKVGRRQSKKEIASVLTKGPVRRRGMIKPRPQTPALPGLEGMVHDRELDSICSGIADNMHAINEAHTNIKGLDSNGLSVLRKKGRTMYRAHGVEIVRVPGDEKLRKRLVKGEGEAEADTTDDLDQDVDNGAAAGAGDDGIFADA